MFGKYTRPKFDPSCFHHYMRKYYTPILNVINEDKDMLEKKLNLCKDKLEEIAAFLECHDYIPKVILESIHTTSIDLEEKREVITTGIKLLEQKLRKTIFAMEQNEELARKTNCPCK